jgi:hypothetical protein
MIRLIKFVLENENNIDSVAQCDKYRACGEKSTISVNGFVIFVFGRATMLELKSQNGVTN